MIRRRFLNLALLGLASAALASCGGPPPPAVLTLSMTAGGDQNPSISGHASPVAIRVIQLTATGGFERADVFSLSQQEKTVLGADDLASEEIVLAPGESRVLTRELKSGTQFIGVMALFRDIDRAKWRVQAPVKTSGPTELVLTTAGTTVTLAPK